MMPTDDTRPFATASARPGSGVVRLALTIWSGGTGDGDPPVTFLDVAEARALAARLAELADRAEGQVDPAPPAA